MGAWGIKLYQNDIAEDVKDEYVTKLRFGYSNEEITENMIKKYNYGKYDEDTVVFYLALADMQWQYGMLLEKVKERAIFYIDNEVDLEFWREDAKMLEKRRKVLNDLREKLNTQNSKPKHPSKISSTVAPYNVGDLLLYQIKSDSLKDNKWYNHYVLFRVIGKSRSYLAYLPKDKMYYEGNVLAIYNWVGIKYNGEILEKLTFIKKPNNHKILDERFDDIDKIDKKIGFEKISTDDTFVDKKIVNKEILPNLPDNLSEEDELWWNQLGIEWSLGQIAFEYGIIESLEKAAKEGFLIEEK